MLYSDPIVIDPLTTEIRNFFAKGDVVFKNFVKVFEPKASDDLRDICASQSQQAAAKNATVAIQRSTALASASMTPQVRSHLRSSPLNYILL